MTTKNIFSVILTLASALGPAVVKAELQLGSLFSDHMVLQRNMPVPVWGTADPGANVTVDFAGQKKSAMTSADGKWKVTLDPIGGSFKGRVLNVLSQLKSKSENQKCSDVLVGEVWICSGQSNMQFGVNAVPEVKALIPKAKNIRSFAVKRTVAFTEQERCEGEWVDRYPDSAVAFGFAHALQKSAEVPVGIILSCWGSTSIEAWMPRDMTETVPHFKVMMEEFDANTKAHDEIKAALNGPQPWNGKQDVFLRRQNMIIYNAMIHPLAPYACRGLVWYQGERNTQSMSGMLEKPWWSRVSGMLNYGDVLKQWVKRYRQQWGRDDMSFLVVMLPGYGAVSKTSPKVPANNPAAHSWAWMREAQLEALDLPHTAVANTIDLGDVKNVHPKDKLPVGQRLALLAARDTLGKDIEAEGPVFNKVEKKGDTLVVHFEHDGGLKTADGSAPEAFWLADEREQWVPAEAAIDGQTVVLKSPELEKPLYVRYAFVGKPDVNLVNGDDLPAYPFRTDRFDP